MRRRVCALPGATILDRHDVTSLVISGDARQVTGVMWRLLDVPALSNLLDNAIS
jgi:hypothetical protein